MAEKESSSGLPVPLVVAGALLLLLATASFFWYRQAQRREPQVPVLTREAAAYLPNLELDDVEMKAAENYLKQTATTINGKITNKGPRTVRLVEINCVFRNFAGQVVLRERTAIVGRKTGSIPSGQARSFELTFDNIPQAWNQMIPDLVIAQIIFQD